MHPVLLELGPITLYTYGFMIALGFLIALFLLRRDAPHSMGITPDTVNEMAFWVLITGLAGTRILHIILYPDHYSLSDPVGWFAIWRGGLVFQGAVPTALLYYYFAARRYGIPFWRGLDVAFSYVPLGHAFGRIGCFMFGCCYGKPTEVPWGVAFPKESPAWDHGLHAADAACTYTLHPTQLYSVVGLLVIFGVLIGMRRYLTVFDGAAAAGYLVLYGAFRFVVEFFRGDNAVTELVYGVALSHQQVFSLGMILVGCVLALGLWRYQPDAPETHEAPDAKE